MTAHDTLDIETLRCWVGKERTTTDVIRAQPVAFLRATLDSFAPDDASEPQPGEPLPPTWHWLFFLEAAPLSQLGADGHRARGEFLPPVALPRRMWAGGRLAFIEPLTIGATIRRRSTIAAVERKRGRSGELCFVTVRHELFERTTLKMTEEHDIFYRQRAAADAPPPMAPTAADARARITAGATMLFRYSALTFNSHRIHYDLDYCREVEGLPGLLVHGPLTATLLADLARAQCGEALCGFEFRAVSPLLAEQPFTIALKRRGRRMELWAANARGELAMRASAWV
ncbi:MAG: FAS1-like dehydratase domain-containing protein [bacterium]